MCLAYTVPNNVNACVIVYCLEFFNIIHSVQPILFIKEPTNCTYKAYNTYTYDFPSYMFWQSTAIIRM